jgi:hypothetical protein
MVRAERFIPYLIWMFLLTPGNAFGDEGYPEEAEAAVSLEEVLEFLGGFETAKGEWLDPFELNEMEGLDVDEKEKLPTPPSKKEDAHDSQ